MTRIYDCVVIGGGPAGLSAALLLGRCLRHVLLCDSGQYRNACVRAMHGVVGMDGIDPAELRRRGREQLAPYESIAIIEKTVTRIAGRAEAGFEVVMADERVWSRTLILATGIVDQLPDLPGLAELYGCTVHVCPYCDAFEHRGQPMAVYGQGERGAGLAMMLRHWSDDIVLVTDGCEPLPIDVAKRLAARAIGVRSDKVLRLEGADKRLEAVVFENGERLLRRALFFCTGQRQRFQLLDGLGCASAENGGIACGLDGETSVPGVYVAGDASRDLQMAIVAAAEGARAAIAVNRLLLQRDGLLDS